MKVKSPWLPYAVATASAISLSVFALRIIKDCHRNTSLDRKSNGCDDLPSTGMIAASTLVTVPWMRIRFSKAAIRLDGLEVRPASNHGRLSFSLSF